MLALRARPTALLRAGAAAVLLGAVLGCASPVPTPAAVFDVSGLRAEAVQIAQAGILPGDEVEVMASVTNSGKASGSYRAELGVDGVVEARQDVALDAGQAMTTRFVIAAGPPGDHEITIGAAMVTLHVVAAAAFQVSDLRLALSPPQIQEGDALEYVVTVANQGSQAGTYNAVLNIDGVAHASQSVAVEAGAAAVLRFPIVAGSPGVHTIEVGDARASHAVLAPALLAVTDLQLTESAVPTSGDVEAIVTVTNSGGAAGTLTVRVTIDGKVAATPEVMVAGGDRQVVQLPVATRKAGRHTVAAGAFKQGLVVWKITRPANGTVLANKVKGGMGRLTIRNGDQDRDAVIVFAKSSRTLLAVYVRANKSYTVKNIKDGTYAVYFTFGERWDSYSKAFTSSLDRRRFSETLRFKTTRTSTAIRYSVVTISLHQAGGGGLPTDPVDEDAFPSVP